MIFSQLKQGKNLIEDYEGIFLSKCQEATYLVTHKIDVGSNIPINQMPYRVSPKERTVIQFEVQRMLNENMIEPSKSPWASTVFLVTKKMGP